MRGGAARRAHEECVDSRAWQAVGLASLQERLAAHARIGTASASNKIIIQAIGGGGGKARRAVSARLPELRVWGKRRDGGVGLVVLVYVCVWCGCVCVCGGGMGQSSHSASFVPTPKARVREPRRGAPTAGAH